MIREAGSECVETQEISYCGGLTLCIGLARLAVMKGNSKELQEEKRRGGGDCHSAAVKLFISRYETTCGRLGIDFGREGFCIVRVSHYGGREY